MARPAPTLSSKRSNLHGLFRLSRPLNLLIAAGTLSALRYGWMSRWTPEGHFMQLPGSEFVVGALVVIVLMAAGNLINAYFDVTEDRINQPDLAIVDRTIKRRVLIIAHGGLDAAGIGLAAWLTARLGTWWPVTIAGAVAFSLWKYSARWKGVPVLGNVIVALMLGLVPIWLAVLEAPFHTGEAWHVYWPLAGFAGMAFGVGLAREIVKDARDAPGDIEAGKRSIPIAFGMTVARNTVLLLLVLLTAVYCASTWWISPHGGDAAWVTWMAPLPFLVLAILAVSGRQPHWVRADRWLLLTLVAGFVQCLWIQGF